MSQPPLALKINCEEVYILCNENTQPREAIGREVRYERIGTMNVKNEEGDKETPGHLSRFFEGNLNCMITLVMMPVLLIRFPRFDRPAHMPLVQDRRVVHSLEGL